MELYWSFAAFTFGAIIGSFLDVVAYRFHTGKSINGRSHCLSCRTQLRWYELVPVVSYLALRGRCSTCGARIPFRCFLMEVASGSAFLLIYQLYVHDVALLFLHFGIVAVLILIVAYDLRHTIIPDELVAILGALALCVVSYTAFAQGGLAAEGLWVFAEPLGAAAAGGAFLGSFWLVSGGRWMGLGDAKLMVPLGFLLGFWGTFSALVFSFWIGALVGVALIALGKLLHMQTGTTRVPFLSAPLRIKSEIPFAPFLIAGFALVHFFHVDLFQALPFIYPF